METSKKVHGRIKLPCGSTSSTWNVLPWVPVVYRNCVCAVRPTAQVIPYVPGLPYSIWYAGRMTKASSGMPRLRRSTVIGHCSIKRSTSLLACDRNAKRLTIPPLLPPTKPGSEPVGRRVTVPVPTRESFSIQPGRIKGVKESQALLVDTQVLLAERKRLPSLQIENQYHHV